MYTEETIRIAATLAVNSEARRKVIALIRSMDEHIVYSGQRFDQTQQLASLLNELDTDTYHNDSLPAKLKTDAEWLQANLHEQPKSFTGKGI